MVVTGLVITSILFLTTSMFGVLLWYVLTVVVISGRIGTAANVTSGRVVLIHGMFREKLFTVANAGRCRGLFLVLTIQDFPCSRFITEKVAHAQ